MTEHDYYKDIASLDVEDVIDEETRTAMARMLKRSTDRRIQKFIVGQKKHGGSIVDRALLRELTMELDDAFWYLEFYKDRVLL